MARRSAASAQDQPRRPGSRASAHPKSDPKSSPPLSIALQRRRPENRLGEVAPRRLPPSVHKKARMLTNAQGLHGTRVEKLPKGPYSAPDRVFQIQDALRRLPRKPISEAAKD